MIIEKSSGAVVFRREGNNIFYLLLHHENGHWDFPKGNIEKGESIEETASREITEETGISDIGFLPDFKEYIRYFYKRQGKTIFKTVTFFLAETKTREVKISPEHTGFQWLEEKKSLDCLSYDNGKEIIKKASHYLLSPKRKPLS